MSRLRPGGLQNLYAWACCVFGATTVGQGYLALSLGVTGSAASAGMAVGGRRG